ncbi:hypothetical protein BRC81_13615 [Halobacteriales archaeon QS_1_68_20]|nr:MAG: hypothetical protein BRC81_13615 [Halobacteriales archaeon QS_1_68_20]
MYPAQNAALPQIVDDEQLVRANSLFSVAFQSANVVFNAASGLLIAVVGAVSLFLVNSATFAVAAVLFMGITVASSAQGGDAGDSPDETAPGDAEDDSTGAVPDDGPADSPDAEPGDAPDEPAGADAQDDEPSGLRDHVDQYLDELRDGFSYVAGSVLVFLLLGAMFANVSLGAMFAVLPVFADLFGEADAYGVLMAAFAGGSLLGSIGATMIEEKPFGKASIASFGFSGVAILLALAVPGFALTAALLFIAVVPVGAFNVMFFSLLQSAVEEDTWAASPRSRRASVARRCPSARCSAGSWPNSSASRPSSPGSGPRSSCWVPTSWSSPTSGPCRLSPAPTRRRWDSRRTPEVRGPLLASLVVTSRLRSR